MNTVPLLQVTTLAPERVHQWTGARGYVATGDADDQGALLPNQITWEERPSRADLVAVPGDVLMARMAGTQKVFGINDNAARHVFSTGFAVLRPDKNKLDSGFLRHWLRTAQFQTAKDRVSAGATQRAVTNAGLQQLTIPLPSLSTQIRIAAILDQADLIRTKRRQALSHLESLTEAAFHDMFGDLPASTTVQAKASLIRTGPFGSQLRHGEFVDVGIAVLGLDNVVGNQFRWHQRRYITPTKYQQLKRYTVRPGDVLISIMGTVGRCVVVPDDIPAAINTKHICAITPDPAKLDSAFLRASFLWHRESRAHLRRQTKGSIMDGLNMGIIKAMPIPVPPLSHQTRFAEKAAAVEAQRAEMAQSVAADNELFASLQSRAFRGEL